MRLGGGDRGLRGWRRGSSQNSTSVEATKVLKNAVSRNAFLWCSDWHKCAKSRSRQSSWTDQFKASFAQA